MKVSILFFLLTAYSFGFSQMEIAWINDSDGYTNIRSGPGIESEILGKVFQGEYFYVSSPDKSKHNWLEILCICKEGDFEGFIHKSRVQLLAQLPLFQIKKQLSSELEVSREEIAVKITIQDFKASDHEIEKDAQGFVQIVDGESPLGVDGNLPSSEVKSITITTKNGVLNLPDKAIKGIFEPDLHRTSVYIEGEDRILIYMSNSDGAGGYSVIWVVENGEYINREIISI